MTCGWLYLRARARNVAPRRWTRLLVPTAVAAIYAAVALLMTVSVWSSPTTRTIGYHGDPEKFIGFLTWFPFAITHAHNPLHLSFIELPGGVNAMWDTTMPFASIAAWPLRALLGVVGAYNALQLIAMTLNGLCTYLWLQRHVRHRASAFAGGLFLVVGPYADGRAYGHLNLLLFFAVPLMFIVVEDLAREPRRRPWIRGGVLGVLAAVQLLCTEEILALTVIALVIALAIASLVQPRAAIGRLRGLGRGAVAAAAAFLLVAGIPLAYQFLGPLRPHGALQPHDVYVNDLLNFVVPTRASAISLTGWPGPWTGNAVEWNAYVGLPLLVLVATTAFVGRRDRWLITVALATAAVAILSLGPHLHVNGVDHRHVLLPESLLDSLPVFGNIVPSRFSLLMDLGVAGLLTVFIDSILAASPRWRFGGSIVLAAVVVTMWPAEIPSVSSPVPRFFQDGGDVDRLAPGSVALVFPLPYVSAPPNAQAAVWQAVADFRFKMISGASITITPSGATTFGSPEQPLRCVTDSLQVRGTDAPCATSPVTVLAQLRSLHTRYVIVGPGQNTRAISTYLSRLTGTEPRADEGVLVWTL